MWIKITPQKFENERIERLREEVGVLETDQVHVNTDHISTVKFGEGVAQIRMSNGTLYTLNSPEEIEMLKKLVEGGEEARAFVRELAAHSVAAYIAEDAAPPA